MRYLPSPRSWSPYPRLARYAFGLSANTDSAFHTKGFRDVDENVAGLSNSGIDSIPVDAIDRLLMNTRQHFLGSAARVLEPVQHLAVLTCMDARIDVSALLGLRPGDAHVIRNAGGRASNDALHSLAVSQAVLKTREVMVIHHTECGMGRFNQAELAEQISTASGYHFNEELGTFADPLAAIVEDVERIRACPYIPFRNRVRGFMYDLAANTVTEVRLSNP